MDYNEANSIRCFPHDDQSTDIRKNPRCHLHAA